MNEPSDQDFSLSFMFINYLNSGYQASLASLSFLHEMGASSYETKQFQFTNERLSTLASWLQKLTSGEPLLRADWKAPQTKEAKEAFSTAESLKRELIFWTNEVHRILGAKSYTYNLEDTKILISQFGRVVYSQAYFFRGMREYGKILRSDELQKDIDRLAPTTEKELDIVHSMIDTVKVSQSLQSDFFQSLTFHSYEIPTRIYTQIHDLNLLISTYDNGFTFERAGIGREEAEQWMRASISPIEASFWRAHAIGPSETVLWKQLNIPDPSRAALWKRYQFPPEEAIKWITRNFSPPLARRWRDSGYSPEQAQAKIAEQQAAQQQSESQQQAPNDGSAEGQS